ncbi:MAG: Spo0B domain-containing protein [Treponema sp.]|nr:Spo0B domain-containing protein [Treponema sp.]
MSSRKNGNLNSLRREIRRTQLILIISVTLLLSIGGAFISIRALENDFSQSLQNTAELITRLYRFTNSYSEEELTPYMDSVVQDLTDVDIISIVDSNLRRRYHTHHELIGTVYDGTIPDFSSHPSGYYTEDDKGPSGPQRRTYSAIYADDGTYRGFIMTIRLNESMQAVIYRILALFIIVTVGAITVELIISFVLSKKIKKEFLDFTEDFEGTKILVDSMRANNHDFTNKLHVILGLIQIGEYDKAVSYIQNITIIQRETISTVMNAIDNPSFAALIVGKIARASECDVRFILQEQSRFVSSDITVPSEALVTITGNLIDNALDEMNRTSVTSGLTKQLEFGVYTKPDQLLITVKDSGGGIPEDIQDKIFDCGFSTKGTGRGIGLYHTKQLIESMGGTISFETEEDKGTCFMVTIGTEGKR